MGSLSGKNHPRPGLMLTEETPLDWVVLSVKFGPVWWKKLGCKGFKSEWVVRLIRTDCRFKKCGCNIHTLILTVYERWWTCMWSRGGKGPKSEEVGGGGDSLVRAVCTPTRKAFQAGSFSDSASWRSLSLSCFNFLFSGFSEWCRGVRQVWVWVLALTVSWHVCKVSLSPSFLTCKSRTSLSSLMGLLWGF